MVQAQIFADLEELKGDQSVHDYIIKFLAEKNIAGATSFRGHAGFGKNHKLKFPGQLFSFDETTAVIIFIDEEDKARSVIAELKTVFPARLITLFPVEIF